MYPHSISSYLDLKSIAASYKEVDSHKMSNGLCNCCWSENTAALSKTEKKHDCVCTASQKCLAPRLVKNVGINLSSFPSFHVEFAVDLGCGAPPRASDGILLSTPMCCWPYILYARRPCAVPSIPMPENILEYCKAFAAQYGFMIIGREIMQL